MNRILIINGSLNKNGNCKKIIDNIKNINKNVAIVNCYPSIKPCLDCGGCEKAPNCIINDDFKLLLSDDYDCIIIISPIYMSNLTGPMFNLISRFNFLFNNELYLNHIHKFKEKRGVIFLVGGGHPCRSLMGETNEDLPIKQCKYILKKLNAKVTDDDIVTWLNSDSISYENSGITSKINKILK